MSDRSGAWLFGQLFGIVAQYVPHSPEREALVSRFWDLTRDYDFAPYQMDADEALFVLGLARRGVDPDWPEEGETILYGPIDR